MRTCKKCGEPKPEGEFYKRSAVSDGIDQWCKVCRNAANKAGSGAHKLAPSTEQAIVLLSQNGIPATMGIVAGRPGTDLVAYGYLTIEAKSAHPSGKSLSGYAFGFTKAQLGYRCDYYVLIFKGLLRERVFIIPGASDLLVFPGEKLYLNIADSRLVSYENNYVQIKARVVNDMEESEPIEAVRVFAWNKQYQVDCA